MFKPRDDTKNKKANHTSSNKTKCERNHSISQLSWIVITKYPKIIDNNKNNGKLIKHIWKFHLTFKKINLRKDPHQAQLVYSKQKIY
jgi:hypothetical protein